MIVYLCRKVIAELEFLEEGGHEDGGKEENDTPEEDVRNVGTMGATGAAHKLPTLFNTILQQQVDGVVIYTFHMISSKSASADSMFPQTGFMSIRVDKKKKKRNKNVAFIVICNE